MISRKILLKSTYPLLFFLFLTSYVKAQNNGQPDKTRDDWLNNNGNIITKPSFSGNVGIGVANPNKKLEVDGNSRFRGKVIVDQNLKIKGTTKALGDLKIKSLSDTAITYVRPIGLMPDGVVRLLHAPRFDSLFIASQSIFNGNVGIGVTNPGALLEVGGMLKTEAFQLQDNAGIGKVLMSDSDGIGTWQDFPSLSDNDWQTGQGVIYNTSDFVGIGTPNPNHFLHIKSTEGRFGNRTFARFTNEDNSTHSANQALVETGTGTNRVYTGLSVVANSYIAQADQFGEVRGGSSCLLASDELWIIGGHLNQGVGSDIRFFTDVIGGLYQEKMILTGDGNLGVGESSPQNRLDVNGKIRMQQGAIDGYIPVAEADGVMTWTDPEAIAVVAGGNPNFQTMDVAEEIKVGANSIYIGQQGTAGVVDNYIYATEGPLRINGDEGQLPIQNTLLNPDGGKVGIAKSNPQFELDVSGTIGVTAPNNATALRLTAQVPPPVVGSPLPVPYQVLEVGVPGGIAGTTSTVAAVLSDGTARFKRLSIGTSAPAARFHVSNAQDDTTTPDILIENRAISPGRQAELRLSNVSLANVKNEMCLLYGIEGSITAPSNAFRLRRLKSVGSGEYLDYLKIDETTNNILFNADINIAGENFGKIGVGTATPEALLHVKSTLPRTTAEKLAVFANENNQQLFLGTELGNGAYSWMTKDGDAGIFWNDGTPGGNGTAGLVLAAANPSFSGIRIDATGKMGIGTKNPENLLHVESPNDAIIRVKSSSGYGSNVCLKAVVSNNIKEGQLQYEGRFLFHNTTMVENTMVINGDGNVGIGTFNTAGFKLSVEGNIRAREVRVNSLAWADFVFDKNYTLMSIAELENYINDQGHLPGVPSQKEVEQDGIDLGRMDAILLQKIEELTLYVIDLQKENEKMKALISKKAINN